MKTAKLTASLLLPAFILAISILAYIQIPVTFESSQLLLILNTLFIGLIPMAIAYLAARVYMSSGSTGFLLMGCGMLTFGLSSILAAAFINLSDGPNILVTIHNSGVLLSAICQTIGAMLFIGGGTSWAVRGKGPCPVIGIYGGVVLLTLLFSLVTAVGFLPRFFVQGVGPTVLRQFVLISAMNLYIFSAVLFMIHYRRWRSDFIYWYALALAMISVGLFGILLQKSVGCPIGWLGRSAQYLGGSFGLIAILMAVSGAISKKLSIEESIALLFLDAETSYRNLVEMAADSIITFDQDGRIIGWNSAAERMFDRSKSEAIGSIFFNLIIPSQYAVLIRTQIESLREKSQKLITATVAEIEARRKNGALFPVEVSLSVREAPQGWLCSCIVRDISDRKQAEVELRKSEEKFRRILETANEGFWIMDGLHTTELVNKKMADMLGYDVEEIVGKKVEDFIFADDMWSHEMKMADRHQGQTASYERRFRKKDGTALWALVSATAMLDPDGHFCGSFAMFTDITERKFAEQKLQKSEERYRKLVEFLPKMIGVHVKQKWVYMNPAGVELLGARHEKELLGREVKEIVSPEFWDVVRSRVEKIEMEGTSTPEIEQKFIRMDGERIDVSVAGVPIDFHGESGVLVFAEDISSRKSADEELRRSHDELKRSNTELEQFAYVASHDMQEPLRMVSSYMQLIERRYKGQLDADADDFIGYAVDGAKRMRLLIRDLLEYSRVGTHGKTFGAVDCETLLTQVINHLQLSIEDNGATVTHDQLPIVIADGDQLARVFQNLINNALKFRKDAPPSIHISVEPNDNDWQFSVSDNGIGIEPQYADRIFVIFQRLHSNAEYPGTGIGLAICKKIVERHGGRIWVRSEQGDGATFIFAIPKQDTEF
ncbi:MAG: PAS domain S-box protein [Desulfomonilaceae bacterium]|jgi:PAS domain S-box-containing protein